MFVMVECFGLLAVSFHTVSFHSVHSVDVFK